MATDSLELDFNIKLVVLFCFKTGTRGAYSAFKEVLGSIPSIYISDSQLPVTSALGNLLCADSAHRDKQARTHYLLKSH